MRFVFFVIFSLFVKSNAISQEFNLKINLAPSYTIIPDYTNTIYLAEDFIVPDLIIPTNAQKYSLFQNKTHPSSNLNLDFEIELGLKLNKNYRIVLLTSVNQISYKYNTIVFDDNNNVKLNDISSDYGEYHLLYLNFKPLNFSSVLFNEKVHILFGPSFNYLLFGNYESMVVKYKTITSNNEEIEVADKAYYDTTSKVRSFISGVNLRLNYQISNKIGLFVSSQYYFNSIFDKEQKLFPHIETTTKRGEDIKPLRLQVGCSLDLF